MAACAQHLRLSLTAAMTGEISGSVRKSLYQALRILCNMSDAAQPLAPRLENRDADSILWEVFSRASALTERELRYAGLSSPIACPVDAQMLERGVHNMLSNAIKFSPVGSIIHARLSRRGKLLCLTVSNTGQWEHCSGLGLGMHMIRAAAAAHGGTVLAEHTPGREIRVTLTLRTDLLPTASPLPRIDYAGEWDHALLEFSEILPPSAYE